MSSASPTSGYSVPSSTIAHATVSIRLPTSIMVSREASANDLPPVTFGARNAYSSSDPPTTTARYTRMNTPRAGANAKA
jgi:hypothetical protein